MKATEMLNQVKELLGVQEEITLAQVALENGTILEAESLEAGKEIFIVTEDEKVALPVGDYSLEDGQMLKVEEEGIIASIGAAEAKEEEVEAEVVEASEEVEAAEEDKEEMGYATKEELAEVKKMIEEIKSMLEPKEEMSAEEQPEEKVEEVKEELSAIEEEPKKIKHNPEAVAEKQLNLYGQKRPQTTLDRVLQKMNNFKN